MNIPITTRLPIPNEYDDLITRLAKELESAGVVTIDGRAAVMIAAVNLLNEFMTKIRATTEEEQTLRLRILADLAEIRELSN